MQWTERRRYGHWKGYVRNSKDDLYSIFFFFFFNPKTFSMLADKVVEQNNKHPETDTFTNHIPEWLAFGW